MVRQKDIDLTLVRQDGTLARFWGKVDTSGDCWEWTAAKMRDGYGRFRLNGSHYPSHRISYAMAHGRDPEDLPVCHRCDNPSCVRPSHLFLGTLSDNTADMVQKGRAHKARGEDSPVATVSNAMAKAIRDTYEDTGVQFKELAAMFNVPQYTVQRIITGRTYSIAGGPTCRSNTRSKRGSSNGRAILTEEKVRMSRELYANGCQTIGEIAALNGVNEDTMRDAIMERTWKHV